MICSKCQLPTAETDLVDAVCGPCRGEVITVDESSAIIINTPSEFGKMMAKSRAEYKYDVPLTTGQASYRNAEPMKTDPFVAAALREEGLPEVLGPIVSPQPNHRPGRTIYGLQYRCGEMMGNEQLTSAEQVGRMIRNGVGQGMEILRVTECREMLPDEYGGPVEVMFLGEWSRERIDETARGVVGVHNNTIPYSDQIKAELDHLAKGGVLYGDTFVKVKQAVKNKATRQYYGGRDDVELTGVTTLKDEISKKDEDFDKYLKDRQRRVKAFGVSRDRVLQFLTRGCRYVTADIPEGVEILEVHEDPMRWMFVFTLRHDSFPPVPEGQVLEMIRPVWEIDTSERDLLNLVERAVQLHAQHLDPTLAEEYFKRAQEVCQRLHGKGLK